MPCPARSERTDRQVRDTNMQKALTLLDTSIGKKTLVGVTGAILFAFVIGHVLGNLQIFLGGWGLEPGEYWINEYSEMLHAIPELLLGLRIALLLTVVVHLALAMQLAGQNRGARSARYKVEPEVAEQNVLQRWGRTTMILTGPLLTLYIVFHLAHLTIGAELPIEGYEFRHLHPYENMILTFRDWRIAGIYMAATVMLGFHIFHGGQAVFTTLGLRHPRWDGRTRPAATALAVFVTLANLSIPIAIVSRLIGNDV
jgi:succinate dehydrogenase / fumarate reductase cytochrome b subunit